MKTWTVSVNSSALIEADTEEEAINSFLEQIESHECMAELESDDEEEDEDEDDDDDDDGDDEE